MSDLSNIVEAEAEVVARFVSLLQAEQITLGNGDTDQLSRVTEQKNIIAAELSALAARRNAALAEQKIAPDRPGMEAWLNSHKHDQLLNSLWSKVIALASEARELNRVNGELIQIRMRHNAQALEALRSASRPLSLYGPNGQTSTFSSRSINDAA
jgi:flagella synthesis protein FlgN